jgi:hypothetical protein
MKIHVEIIDDGGEIQAEHTADISQPSVWNAPAGRPFVSKMPQNSDNENNGSYELFRITFAPSVRVQRPNGRTAPPPSPLTGQPGVPSNFPLAGTLSKPSNFPTPSTNKMWSPKSPTPAETNFNSNTDPGCSPASRG